MFSKNFQNMHENTPIVHAMTNYVTVNDCANIILACGASPIMSDEINDLKDIILFSGALVINIGTLNERVVESMIYAGKIANENNVPVILDPVGVGATKYRNTVVEELLQEVKFTAIKANATELKYIASRTESNSGVDAALEDAINTDNLESNIKLFKSLALEHNTIIIATGAIDIITDGTETFVVKNGSMYMGKITGTGCMLGCVIASHIAANNQDHLNATALAVTSFGIAGELAEQTYKGNGSYRVDLIDKMSMMTYEIIEEEIKIEKH